MNVDVQFAERSSYIADPGDSVAVDRNASGVQGEPEPSHRRPLRTRRRSRVFGRRRPAAQPAQRKNRETAHLAIVDLDSFRGPRMKSPTTMSIARALLHSHHGRVCHPKANTARCPPLHLSVPTSSALPVRFPRRKQHPGTLEFLIARGGTVCARISSVRWKTRFPSGIPRRFEFAEVRFRC